jgi:hypothetical protein
MELYKFDDMSPEWHKSLVGRVASINKKVSSLSELQTLIGRSDWNLWLDIFTERLSVYICDEQFPGLEAIVKQIGDDMIQLHLYVLLVYRELFSVPRPVCDVIRAELDREINLRGGIGGI